MKISDYVPAKSGSMYYCQYVSFICSVEEDICSQKHQGEGTLTVAELKGGLGPIVE